MEETCELEDHIDQLSAFDGKNRVRINVIQSRSISAEIEYEAPNNNLGRFEGNLTWKGKTLPLKNDNVLLRGTRLRNTPWAFGSRPIDSY